MNDSTQAYENSPENEDETEDETEEVKLPRSGSAKWLRRRQAVSHAFTLKKMIREDLPFSHLTDLMQDLKDNTGELSVIEQIQTEICDPETIAPFAKGMEELKELSKTYPLFGGRFNMDDLLGLVYNERKVRYKTCRLCDKASPPVEPTQSASVSNPKSTQHTH